MRRKRPFHGPHWTLPLIAAAVVVPPVALWLALGPWAGGATVFVLAAGLVLFAVRSDPGALPSLADRRRAERREVERRSGGV